MRTPTLTLPLGPATAGSVAALEGAAVVVEDDAEESYSYSSSDADLLPPPPLRLSIAVTIEGRGRWRYLTHEDAWRPAL